MTLPFQSQFDSTPTKTDLTEIFSVAGIRTTEGVSDRPARPPRHVSPIEWDKPCAASTCLIAPLSAKNVSLCCISTAIWALP